MEKFFEADRIVGVDLLGVVGSILVFRNWDEKRFQDYPWGLPKIYTFNIETEEQKLLIELDDSIEQRVVMRGDQLIALGREAIRVDIKTGRTEAFASWGSGPKQVIDTGNIILVETSDNQLIALKP